jgi:integrase/recombinase XerD
LAALRRVFSWAAETERIVRNPAQHLTDVAEKPLAPKDFSDVERRRIVRHAEKDGPMAEAIVIVLLNTGLRVEELVTLTWQRVQIHARSGWIDVVGKGEKRRRLPLNVEARTALEAIQPVSVVSVDDHDGALFRGKRGPYTARGIEYLVAELGRRAQVPNVHPHRFRHDTARRLVESVDLPTVAAWLGHERWTLSGSTVNPTRQRLERAAAARESR